MATALITGASSGFGANTAVALAERGWRVFATTRDPAREIPLHALAREAGCAANIDVIPLDVTDPESIATCAAQVGAATDGALDVLVNNAGYCMIAPFEDAGDAECRAQMEANFFGAVGVTRAFLPGMLNAGRGRVVIVSSNAVNAPHPLMTMYAASKWALEGWAEGLAMEVEPFGVDVVVIQPGSHQTPFGEHVVAVERPESRYGDFIREAWPGMHKLGAWGRDPAAATPALVEAVCEANPPFRISLGQDSVAFATLKGVLPYETRAWLVRAIVGLPGRADGPAQAPAAENIGTEVVAQVAAAIAADSSLASSLVETLAPSERRRG